MKKISSTQTTQSTAALDQPLPAQARACQGVLEGLWARWQHLWVALYFTAATLVMTWPLALHMGSAVADRTGDNIYFAFLIAWYQKAWFQLGISPFFHPWLNYPEGWNLASTDTSLATTLVGLPAGALFGPVFGYNFAMLATFVLAGWAMFYWVRRLTGSAGAGLVAGTIYAFLPYKMARFTIGHLNLSGTAWFPLFFMGLYDLLRTPWEGLLPRGKGQWSALLWTAGSLVLIAFTSMHYLLMTAVIAAVFVAGYLLLVDRKQLRQRSYWSNLAGRLGVTLSVAFPLVLLAALPFLQLEGQGGLAERNIDYANMYSASPTDFILPSTAHWLLGDWVWQTFDRSLWVEASFYVGIVALALAVIAWLRRRESGHDGLLAVGLLVIAVAFVLALGIELHWNNQIVEAPLPGFLQGLLGAETVSIPLPAKFLFRYLPLYSKMRAVMRIGFYVLVFTTLFAGLGAAWLLKRYDERRRNGSLPVLFVLLALVFLDFYPGPLDRITEIQTRPVDVWLAQQPGDGAVAQMPALLMEDQFQIYNTLIHGKPFLGGFFSANMPPQYRSIRQEISRFPRYESAMIFYDLGVEWVLFEVSRYPDFDQVRREVERFGIRYVDTIGGQAVFHIDGPPKKP